ncbi:MAG: alpha/beta hydrolase [Clostridia bacterium]|nr:alpha/beta hydrolase [Clostridia bacterium]
MKDIQLWDSVPLTMLGGHVPYMTYYPSEKPSQAAIVIFAGGGYSHRAKHEGEGYAEYFSKEGFHCFVVHYRTNPDLFPCELLDARRGVRYVRANCEQFGVDPDKIAVMGSSAGGHLAALVSTYRAAIEGEGVDAIDDVDPTPNAQVLCYPVLDPEGHPGSFIRLLGEEEYKTKWPAFAPALIADEKTPICFMWHCEGDKVVNAANTLKYSMRLLELGISQETHIYPRGRHGIGLVVNDERFVGEEYMTSWAPRAVEWFKLNGFIK